MDNHKLARTVYEDTIDFAERYEAPRSAIAAAQFRSAIQIFMDQDGAESVAAWLEREAKQFREVLDTHPEFFKPGGTA